MHVIVFIPGIMGTKLILNRWNGVEVNEEIWPPTLNEVILSGYQRTKKLMSCAVSPSEIIKDVCFSKVYSPIEKIINNCGFEINGWKKRYLPFPYDWRVDLFKTAEKLATLLDNQVEQGATEITIVAHSMGGLVGRLAIESPLFRERAFITKVSRFFALGTPHSGAPLALARILGLDSSLGISASDFKVLTNNECFPSAYQLLPAPKEDVCWNVEGVGIEALDIYDEPTSKRLGMSSRLLQFPIKLHENLGASKVLGHVRYILVGGRGRTTVSRLEIADSGTPKIRIDRNSVVATGGYGDGTVPLISALGGPGQKLTTLGQHKSVFDAPGFENMFRNMMGIEACKNFESRDKIGESGNLGTTMQFTDEIIETGKPIELIISFYDRKTQLPIPCKFDNVEANLVLELWNVEKRKVVGNEISSHSIRIQDLNADHVLVKLKPIADPGIYRLRCDSDQLPESATLVVVAKSFEIV